MKWLCMFMIGLPVPDGIANQVEYPGARLTPIGGLEPAHPSASPLAYFTTRDSVAKVAAFFVRTFSSEGWPISLDGDLRDEAVVSAFHTRQGVQVAVVLRRGESGTVAFVVSKNLWVNPASPGDFTVRLEGVWHLEASEADEKGRWATHASVARMDFDAASRTISHQWPRKGLDSRIVAEPGGKAQIWERREGQKAITLSLTEFLPGWVALLETRREVRP